MIPTPEQPTPILGPQKINLLEENPWRFQEEIALPAEQIGAEKWPEMLEKTKETRAEHVIITSTNGKNILVSKIKEGDRERQNYDSAKEPASSSPPIFPHGVFKDLFGRIKDIASVHTHPETEDSKHLPTTTFSAGDIDSYVNGRYRALIMLDRGGAHMLIGMQPYINRREINPVKIIDEAFEKAQRNTETIAEAQVEIARSLGRFGIQYYFTSDTKSTEDGFVKFANVLRP